MGIWNELCKIKEKLVSENLWQVSRREMHKERLTIYFFCGSTGGAIALAKAS